MNFLTMVTTLCISMCQYAERTVELLYCESENCKCIAWYYESEPEKLNPCPAPENARTIDNSEVNEDGNGHD